MVVPQAESVCDVSKKAIYSHTISISSVGCEFALHRSGLILRGLTSIVKISRRMSSALGAQQ